MQRWLIAAGATAGAFMALDFTWLTIMTPLLYRPGLAPLLADRFDPVAAILFYLLYIGGILALAVRPALARGGAANGALVNGALLGAVAYGTYDLTNLATLRGFPVSIVLFDMVWGVVVTTVGAGVGYRVMRALRSA